MTTTLVDNRPAQAKQEEKLTLKQRLEIDLSRVDPRACPDDICRTATLLLKAQEAGFVDLYLKEYDQQGVQNRLLNCPVLHGVFSRMPGMGYGQKMTTAALMLSAEREKLMNDIVAAHITCPTPCRPTDSAQQVEVSRRAERVLSGKEEPPCSSIWLQGSRIKKFCAGIASAFRILATPCKPVGSIAKATGQE